jgi:putative MATE family efflux protein
MSSSPPSERVDNSGSLTLRTLKLAWPACVDQLIQTTILFADILLLSRLGSEVLAGVGVCAVLVFTFAAVYNAVAVASMTVAAQAKGAGRRDVLERGTAQSLLLAVALGVVSGGAGALTAGWTMSVMGTEGAVRAHGIAYMRPVLLASPLYAIALAGGGVLRGVGDTRTPMLYTMISTVAKVFLSVLLIFGKFGFPAMGVAGAGLATAFGYGLNAVLIGVKLSRGFAGVRLRSRSFAPDWGLVRTIVLLWLPVAVEQGIMRAGFVFYMRVVSALGTIALAANQIAMRLESISLTLGFGFSVAATAMVGQAVGRRDLAEAQKSVGVTAKLALAAMGVTGLALLVFRHGAVGLFDPEEAVRGPAVVCAAIAAFELLPLGFVFTFSGALRGAGDTLSPMAVALLSNFTFRLPLVYLLGIKSGLGLPGIWYGTILDWICRSVAIYLVYRAGWWKKRAVFREPCRPGTEVLDAEGICRE